jgi:hypothetical protein
LNHPDVDAEHPFALDYQTIATAQGHDPELQQKLPNKPQQYARIAMSNDVNVICYIPENNTPRNICLPMQPSAQYRSMVSLFAQQHWFDAHFHAHHPINVGEAALILGRALHTAAFFALTAIHGSLKITPVNAKKN